MSDNKLSKNKLSYNNLTSELVVFKPIIVEEIVIFMIKNVNKDTNYAITDFLYCEKIMYFSTKICDFKNKFYIDSDLVTLSQQNMPNKFY